MAIVDTSPYPFELPEAQELLDTLARMFRYESDAIEFVEKHGIDPLSIPGGLAPRALWRRLLEQAALQGVTRRLVEAARDSYPNNKRVPFLDRLLRSPAVGTGPPTAGGALAAGMAAPDDRDLPTPRPPRPGTRAFVGRDRELAEIASHLLASGELQVQVALAGLPGMGKTELARQVAARLQRDRQFPGGIYWFSADVPDLRQQWAALAADLGGPPLKGLGERAAWAVRHVEERARDEATLVVLDNVATWAPPPSPLPAGTSVRLLVTTPVRRLHNSFSYVCDIQSLSLVYARQLLRAVAERDLQDADALLEALDGHVLSIELAATYLREYDTAPGEYLKQLVAGTRPGSKVVHQTSYEATAESAFALLWERITGDLQAAWLTAAQLPSAWFSLELADAIGLDAERRRGLVRLHLLERDAQGRHQMHRLLREFARAEVADAAAHREAVLEGATTLLEAGDRAFLFRRYSLDAETFHHLLADLPADPRWVCLQAACGAALEQLGDLGAARALYERVLAIDLGTYGLDHEIVAGRRATLAKVLEELGELAAARALCEQSLASALRMQFSEHPVVATARANLAGVLHEIGELEPARTLYEQALAAHLQHHGDAHPAVATTRADLGVLLHQLGELHAARALLEQALSSDLASQGEGHPTVARRRASLAGVFRQLGDLPAARTLYEQAFASDLQTYSNAHPTVASRRASLAALLHQLGDLPAARAFYEQALAVNLETYGDDHSAVAADRANLAGLLRDLGDLKAARALYERSLASDLLVYGDDHPTIATTRANLASVLQLDGDLHGARTLYEQTLAAARKLYSDNHPVVAQRKANLGAVLRALGELDSARTLCEQALAAAREKFIDNHPTVAVRKATLAAVLRDQGELETAQVLYEQALATELQVYGEDHSAVATTRANLARLLHKRGDLHGARVLHEKALAFARKKYGDRHRTVQLRRIELADVLRALGEPAAARAHYEEALASACLSYGDDHPSVVTTRAKLAPLLQQLGDLSAARAAYEQALHAARRQYPDDHPAVTAAREGLDALARKSGG